MDNNNKTCIVCGAKSYGKPQCRECWDYSVMYSHSLDEEYSYRVNRKCLNSLFKDELKKLRKADNEEKRKHLCNGLIGIGLFEKDYYENAKLLEKAYEEIEKHNSGLSDGNSDCDDENDFRKKYPCTYNCQDGHYVRSRDERTIDDYLYTKAKLLHAYEPKFRLTEEEQKLCKSMNLKTDCFFPDFYIPEYNLYLEYFGQNDESYKAKTDLKIKIFSERKDINFGYLTYKDSNVLLDRLEDILNKFKH